MTTVLPDLSATQVLKSSSPQVKLSTRHRDRAGKSQGSCNSKHDLEKVAKEPVAVLPGRIPLGEVLDDLGPRGVATGVTPEQQVSSTCICHTICSAKAGFMFDTDFFGTCMACKPDCDLWFPQIKTAKSYERGFLFLAKRGVWQRLFVELLAIWGSSWCSLPSAPLRYMTVV